MSEGGGGGRRTAWVLPVLAFASGTAGLVHELLYLRLLSTALGELFYVHTALVAVFLLAMGVGAALAHRLPRWLFAFEIGLGAHALAFPAILRAFQGSALDCIALAPGLHAVLTSFVLLAWPAACVGLSVPCFAACLAPRLGRGAFARSYLSFNLGAALSLLAVEYGLVRLVGYSRSLCAVGTVNLLIGAALWVGRRQLVPAAREAPAAGFPLRLLGVLFVASTATGVFCALFLKLAYALYHPRRENFALCTAILLLALALGTHLVDRLRWSFARCLSLAAVSLAVVWSLLPFLAVSYAAAPQAALLYAGSPMGRALQGPLGLAVVESAFAALIGGIVYAFLGGTLPALLRDDEHAAARSGRLLLMSGLGNATGLLLFAFLLHPSLPFFSVAGLTVAGLAFAALAAGERLGRLERGALLGAAAFAVLLATLPESMVYTGFAYAPEAHVRTFKSGSDDTTLVTIGTNTRIHYNGLPEIFVGSAAGVNQAEVAVGVVPSLLAPRSGRALVLGLGSGITAGTVATVFARTDVVDLNGAAVPLAEALAWANFRVAYNPRAEFHHQDGRRYLNRSGVGPFDLVVNTVSTPRFYAAAKVYTVEFFDDVKRALAPDGVYATWFSPGETSPAGSQMLLAGLASRFRHCGLATLRRGYYVAACSDRPLARRLAAAALRPDVAQSLTAGLGLSVGAEAYLAAILLTRDLFARGPFEADQLLNQDDFPRLEFHLRDLPTTAVFDPIAAEFERFNISASTTLASPASIDRAVVLSRVNPHLFERMVRPAMLLDPALAEAIRLRAAEGRPPS